MPLPVWIDTDTAIGVPGADVDDGLALIQAFHSPELAVRGVSAVFGNAPLDRTFPLAREVCERFGPGGLPVLPGSASKEDLGRANDAVRGLAGALEREPLAILALGPLTNVATLCRLHPRLARRIESLVVVAGRRPGQEFFSTPGQKQPFPDFNFECDPEAMQVVLDTQVPLVLAPWEVSSHVWITAEDLDRLAPTGASGAYVARHSRDWLRIWVEDMQAPGFNPFDTLAIAWLTHPGLLERFEGAASIEPGPGDTPLLHVVPATREGGRRAVYCHRPHPDFKPLLLSRLAVPAEDDRGRS